MRNRIITLNGLKIVMMLGSWLSLSCTALAQITPIYSGVVYCRGALPRDAADGQTSHTARNSGIMLIVIIVMLMVLLLAYLAYILKRACANAAAVSLFTGYPTKNFEP